MWRDEKGPEFSSQLPCRQFTMPVTPEPGALTSFSDPLGFLHSCSQTQKETQLHTHNYSFLKRCVKPYTVHAQGGIIIMTAVAYAKWDTCLSKA